jgi:hypothetical protein
MARISSSVRVNVCRERGVRVAGKGLELRGFGVKGGINSVKFN